MNSECAVEGCTNRPLMVFGEQWVCGECVLKWHKRKQSSLYEELQEVVNAD